MFCSCAKQEDPFDPGIAGQIGIQGNGQVHAMGPMQGYFLVEPSGLDDTGALAAAFDEAIAFGQGAVVQLLEGEYYLNFIEIREFCGQFKGAGKGKTIITMVPDLDVDLLIGMGLNRMLIRFVGGDLRISDLSIVTPYRDLSTGTQYWIDGLLGLSAATRHYTSEKEMIRAVVDKVGFYGDWYNIDHGLKAEFGNTEGLAMPEGVPLHKMEICVTNCTFEGFWLYGAMFKEINEGRVVLGEKNKGNTFRNNYYRDLSNWHNVNTSLWFESNTFFTPTPETNRYGMDGSQHWCLEVVSSPYPGYLQQVAQTKATTCHIEQNLFHLDGGVLAIYANDRRRHFFEGDEPMLVQVRNNHIRFSGEAFAGIGSFNMSGMVIRNNRFSGTAGWGVRVMGPSPYPYNENGLMLGNNFSTATFSEATVLFQQRSRNWSIVGGNLGENVINYGTGHLITGMNVQEYDGAFGQTITDNLEAMREAMHAPKNRPKP